MGIHAMFDRKHEPLTKKRMWEVSFVDDTGRLDSVVYYSERDALANADWYKDSGFADVRVEEITYRCGENEMKKITIELTVQQAAELRTMAIKGGNFHGEEESRKPKPSGVRAMTILENALESACNGEFNHRVTQRTN